MSTEHKYCAIIIACIALNKVLAFALNVPLSIYYGIMAYGFVIILLKSDSLKLNNLMIIFMLVAVYSLLANNIPSVFKAPQRLIAFFLISGLVGPLFSSEFGNLFRQRIFITINRLLFPLVLLSFLTYVFNITIIETDYYTGLFWHSMVLGPLAGIIFLLSIYLAYSHKLLFKRNDYRRIIFICICILFSFFTMIIASSRSAILGVISGLIFFYFKLYQDRLSKFLTTIVSIIIVLFISFPLWSGFTEGIINKMEYSELAGSFVESRLAWWDAREKEFFSSPIFGIGFATAEISGVGVNSETYGIEPGSSWMSILSMLGVAGFIPIILMFFNLISYLVRNKENRYENAVLGGILFLFITHMFAEGYFLFSGGFLFFYIWLLLGIIYGYKKNGHVQLV